MAALPSDRPRQDRSVSSQSADSAPEPPIRRWPHPVSGPVPVSIREEDPTFHFIRCALSYQNELLAEIKTLLETLTADQSEK